MCVALLYRRYLLYMHVHKRARGHAKKLKRVTFHKDNLQQMSGYRKQKYLDSKCRIGFAFPYH